MLQPSCEARSVECDFLDVENRLDQVGIEERAISRVAGSTNAPMRRQNSTN
jgi:hypothetical protein